ncbi:MAG: HAMP domain-containing sensor histidine kinase [Opitutaceae bacterium]|nr:HAMP domain-containing sensor histidine kinase [Opitutaceae bacterium]
MPAAVFSSPDRATRVGVLTLTAVVFAAVVGFVTFELRRGLRDQILRRDAEVLAGVTAMQLDMETARLSEIGIGRLPGDVFTAVLNASKLAGVIGVRVFDPQRQFAGAVPFAWSEDPPPADEWRRLESGETIARLHGRDTLPVLIQMLLRDQATNPGVPVVEAWVPVRRVEGKAFEGAAQFWTDGRAIAGEFAALDRRLFLQGLLAWIAGTVIIIAALTWAFSRLAAANRELRARTDDLQRANRELVLAAKTSALGTVTAHLIHALKNPIAGLELLVSNRAEPSGREGSGEEFAAATELTRRLRTMVNDVVGVLRDEQSGIAFELSAGEVVDIAVSKSRPMAADRDVHLVSNVGASISVPARRANLAALVLQNLVQNAIEASPGQGSVTISGRGNGTHTLEFTVEDQGPGLPVSVQERLFQPCMSSKAGGSGLGLALSYQLARQAGGRLELLRTDSRGSCFRLVLDSPA